MKIKFDFDLGHGEDNFCSRPDLYFDWDFPYPPNLGDMIDDTLIHEIFFINKVKYPNWLEDNKKGTIAISQWMTYPGGGVILELFVDVKP